MLNIMSTARQKKKDKKEKENRCTFGEHKKKRETTDKVIFGRDYFLR